MRKTAAATILTCVLYLPPALSTASDGVDYSAPYLTVENGELVTKYPPKTHTLDPRTAGIAVATGSPTEDSVVQSGDSAGSTPRARDSSSPLPFVIGVVAVLLAVILLIAARRRPRSGG